MNISHQITGHTKIIGVIGSPISHSRSPQMHNAAISKAGLDYVYVPFHVEADAIENAINGFRALNVVGINVTIPHKQSVMPFLTSISREAELIGAVNTLTFSDGEIHGENTDAPGFIKAMEDAGASPPMGKDVVVIGAGGSARAIVVALALTGAKKVTIANRTEVKAIALAEELSDKITTNNETDGYITQLVGMGLTDARLAYAVSECALIVNTTSATMDNTHPLLIDQNWIQSSTTVYDIVYTPPMTTLLIAASNRGCTIVGGIGMLVHQGAIAFERWTGVKPCVDTMRASLA